MLPDVARGYLMLRGARLGPERNAIVLAAVRQSYTERNVAQALRSTFPINLCVTKELVHVMDDCDEPLMPPEEQSTSEVDSGEIDALITNFETLSNTTEESCPIDEEEAVRTLVTWKESLQTLNVVKRDRNFSQNFDSQRQILSKFAEGRDASAVVALDTSTKTAQNVSRGNQCSRRRCW